MRTNPIKAYFGAAFAQIFAETEYSHWKAILIEVKTLNVFLNSVFLFLDFECSSDFRLEFYGFVCYVNVHGSS